MRILTIGMGWLLLWLFLHGKPGTAAPLLLSDPMEQVPVLPAITVLDDTDQPVDFDQALQADAAGRFRPAEDLPSHSVSFFPRHYWLKFQMHNPLDRARRVYLSYGTILASHVFLHEKSADGTWTATSAQTARPADKKSVFNRYPLFFMEIPPGTSTYYISVNSRGSYKFRIFAWTPEAHKKHWTVIDHVLSLILGGILVMTLYNLTLLVVARDVVFLHLTGYMGAVLVSFYSFYGYLDLFFPPDDPDDMFFTLGSMRYSFSLMQAFMGFLVVNLLSLRRHMPRTARLLLAFSLINLLNMFAPILLDHRLTLAIGVGASLLLGYPLAIYAGFHRARLGSRVAVLYLCSWFVLLVGFAITSASGFPGLEVNFYLARYSNLGARIFEFLLLTWALGRKIGEIERNSRRESIRRVKLETSLQEARSLQEVLLPRNKVGPGVQMETWYSAAEQAGGDWFDFRFDEDNQRVYLVIGDVTGHGLPAALVTAKASGIIDMKMGMLAGEGKDRDPLETLEWLAEGVNRIFYRVGQRTDKYMTMAFVCLDTRTGEAAYLNAGHPQILLNLQGKTRPLLEAGNPLGINREGRFGGCRFRLQPGDFLFCCTDGLLENTGPGGRRLKMRTIRDVMDRVQDQELAVVLDELLQAGRRVWQEDKAGDDTAIVLLRYTGLKKEPQNVA